jgi:uncharacterized pyridoxamine 5'-phosphate oxidase family protein
VFVPFKQWKALIENHTRKKIKQLRTDNDIELSGIARQLKIVTLINFTRIKTLLDAI